MNLYEDISPENKDEVLGKLREHIKIQDFLMRMASQYINLPLGEVDEEIGVAIKEMGEFVDADRVYIFEYDFENKVTNNTYEWTQIGIEPQIDNLQKLPLENAGFWLEQHLKGEPLIVDKVSEITNPEMKKLLEEQGIKSLIAVPLINHENNSCEGFVGFDSVKIHHHYSEFEVSLLTFFGNLLLNLINRSRKDLELLQAKEKAEIADKLKTEFLAQMSHEIRSPLNAVINFTHLIKVELSKYADDELKMAFMGIESASNRIIRTVDLILNMSELQLGSFEISKRKIDLIALFKQLINEYSHEAGEKGIELLFTSQLNSAEIYSDEYALNQTFANLIDNSIKYTNNGKVVVELLREGSEYKIIIEDTGVGISEEYLKKLFIPFSQEEQGYTRKYEGTGLGLALVKEYCNMLGASINLESKKNVGTKVFISINDM